MIKFIKYLVCLLIMFSLFGIGVYGDMNLKLEKVDSYDKVYNVDVLVNENFRLDNKGTSISLPDGFGIYKACENLNGVTVSDCKENGIRIGYKYPFNLDTTLSEIPGKIVIKFSNAATLGNDTYADIVMTIDNIKIRKWFPDDNSGMTLAQQQEKINRLNEHPVMILLQGPETISTEANSNESGFSVSYDIAFELRKDNRVVENLNWGIIFRDIDIVHSKKVKGETHYEYSESIKLLWGVKDNIVYMLNESGNYLWITEDYTKFSPKNANPYASNHETVNLGQKDEYGNLLTPSSEYGGFAVIVDSGSFKYNWTGSGCGTDISFITNPPTGNVSKVVMIFVLLGISCLVMFIFSRKINKF